MSRKSDQIIEHAIDLAHHVVTTDWRQRAIRRRKRRKRVFVKVVRTIGLMWLATFLIVGGMIASGQLFGPRAVEGLVATPLALLVAWASILFFSLRTKAAPRVIATTTDLAQLPARTEEWLEGQRATLPFGARAQLDAIALQLEALTPQLQALDPQQPAAYEVRRLIAEELPELVRGYQKVPRGLQQQPLNGGPSPDRQLVEGLATVEEAIGRMHAQLARDDLHALATQQRYLEIKYKGDDDEQK
jgi:hypothetical protein